MVKALEMLSVPFTGASSEFYEPSKETMKMVANYEGVRSVEHHGGHPQQLDFFRNDKRCKMCAIMQKGAKKIKFQKLLSNFYLRVHNCWCESGAPRQGHPTMSLHTAQRMWKMRCKTSTSR